MDKSTLSEQCYESLKDDIVNGYFSPGERLGVHKLQARYTMGASPIREALAKLSDSGLINSAGQKGFHVANVSEQNAKDIYWSFNQLEAIALKHSIENRSDEWEANIIAKLHQLAKVENRRDKVPYLEWTKKNYDFHHALIANCCSPTLLKLREQVYWQLEHFIRLIYKAVNVKALRVNHEEHATLARLVLDSETDKAITFMEQHICGTMDEMIAILKTNYQRI